MSSLPPPTDALTNFVNEQILIKCRNGRQLKAKLIAFDEHLNMLLEGVEETNGPNVREMPMTYMRGDAVMTVGRPKE